MSKRDKVQYLEFKDEAVNPLLKVRKDKDNNKKRDIPSLTTTKPDITPVHSSGDLLSRVSAFLPKLAQANKELEKEMDKSRFRIEVCSDQDSGCEDDVQDEGEGRVVEMNIGIGVLEVGDEEKGKDGIQIWINDNTSNDSDSSQ